MQECCTEHHAPAALSPLCSVLNKLTAAREQRDLEQTICRGECFPENIQWSALSQTKHSSFHGKTKQK